MKEYINSKAEELESALQENDKNTVDCIFDDIDLKFNNPFSAYDELAFVCSRKRYNETLKLLISITVNVNKVDGKGFSFLAQSVLRNNLAMTKFLLKDEFLDVNYIDSDGYAALHYCAFSGNTDILNEFIIRKEGDVDLEIMSADGALTPLIIAVQKGFIWLVKDLLDNGVDPYMENAYGRTAVEIAREQGRLNILNEMFSYHHLDYNDVNVSVEESEESEKSEISVRNKPLSKFVLKIEEGTHSSSSIQLF